MTVAHDSATSMSIHRIIEIFVNNMFASTLLNIKSQIDYLSLNMHRLHPPSGTKLHSSNRNCNHTQLHCYYIIDVESLHGCLERDVVFLQFILYWS